MSIEVGSEVKFVDSPYKCPAICTGNVGVVKSIDEHDGMKLFNVVPALDPFEEDWPFYENELTEVE